MNTKKSIGLRWRFADVGLALGAVGVVAMLVVPLPTPLLDVLLTANLSIAVVILLVSLYVPNALRMTTFPALLLLTTLFRLSLNVSSTRLILLQADAGRVIDAFGDFVVRGDYIVGAVVFAILTIVQFVVVARGAGRVSEVAARFTLDALPGKQLAIDAELAGGALGAAQAREARAALERESQLFGAMDGAMKFVKGDAIVGVAITSINIVAGIVIGVVRHGMSLVDAAQTYSILTIGDGLVTQLPALLIATAAGIVVTRVSPAEPDAHLGRELVEQLTGYPRALAVAAALLMGLAFVPGLPGAPFLVAGIAVGAVAFAAGREMRSERPRAAAPLMPMLQLSVSRPLKAAFEEGGGPPLSERLDGVNAELRAELGVTLPPVAVEVGRGQGWSCTLLVEQVPVLRWRAPDNESPRAEDALIAIARSLRRHVGDFVDIQSTQAMLDVLQRERPALVAATVPHVVSVQQLSVILRRLVSEDVSILHLPRILGILADFAPTDATADDLVAIVREGLARYISHRFAQSDGVLAVLAVDPAIEAMVAGAVRASGPRTYLALEPELQREIIDAVLLAVERGPQSTRPVLLTEQRARGHLKRLLQHDLPDAVVLATSEVSGTPLTKTGRVSVGGAMS